MKTQKKLSQIIKQPSIVYKGVTLCDRPLTIPKIQHFNHGVVQRVVNSKKAPWDDAPKCLISRLLSP